MPVDPGGSVPLHVHARYSLAEILAAFGVPNPAASRGSCVKWIEDAQADVFWFNLRKTEKHFSPTTMYADRAISPTLFQWESQSATSEASPTGTALRQPPRARLLCASVLSRVQGRRRRSRSTGVPLRGPATYVSHTGERPMRIIWKLDYELPADVFHDARVATA